MEGNKLSIECVGMNVRAARVMAGIKSDAELADKLGISRQNLSRRLVGTVKFKKNEKEKIAELTGKTVIELFGMGA